LKNINKQLEELSCLKRKKIAQEEKETKQLTKLQKKTIKNVIKSNRRVRGAVRDAQN